MQKKMIVFVGKNKQTGNYLGVDEYGEMSDLNIDKDIGTFVSNLFWAMTKDEQEAKKHVEEYYPNYKLVKAELTLSIKEMK